MYKVQGNRLRFLGHQGPLPLMSPGGLDPSDTIMSKDTIMPTRYVDSYAKIFLILYPLHENSTTRIAISSNSPVRTTDLSFLFLWLLANIDKYVQPY